MAAIERYSTSYISGICQESFTEQANGKAPECYKTCHGYDKEAGTCFQYSFVKPIFVDGKTSFLSIETESIHWDIAIGYGNQDELVKTMSRVAYDTDGQACFDCSMFVDNKCMMMAWMEESAARNIDRFIKIREKIDKKSIDIQINNLTIASELIKSFHTWIGAKVGEPTQVKDTTITGFLKKQPTVPGVEAVESITITNNAANEEEPPCDMCGCEYDNDNENYPMIGNPHICDCHNNRVLSWSET